MDEARYREAEGRLWGSVGATPTERWVHLERNDVNVRVQELGEGPPVVFVHGGSNSGTSWATLVVFLEGFRCILLDRPGCGLSEPLKTVLDVEGLARFADVFLVDVLDSLGLDSTHLAATSYGGYFALRAAAAHPDRFRRMVQFSWPVGARATGVPKVMRIAAMPVVGRLFAAMPASERGVRMIFRQLGHGASLEQGRITPEMVDWFVHLLRDTATMRNETSLVRGFFTPSGRLNSRLVLSDELLAGIPTPVYFLWGEKDPMGGVEVARELVDAMPDAELEVLPDIGHAPWLDDPELVAKATSRFLSSGTAE